MSEEIARILLTDAAGADGPPPVPSPAALLARARTEQRRRERGLILMAVVLSASLTASMVAIQLELTSPRKPSHSIPSAAPAVSPPPDVVPSQQATGSAATDQPTAPPWPSDVYGTPHCPWNDALPPKIKAGLPINGVWGDASQVFGICGKGAAAAITVTAETGTGQVMVVISELGKDGARKEACGTGTTDHCEKITGGYLYWNDDVAESRASARLGLTSGMFIDVMCDPQAVDRNGESQGMPKMDHAPCTGQQAAHLARELAKTNWLQ